MRQRLMRAQCFDQEVVLDVLIELVEAVEELNAEAQKGRQP